MITVADAVTKKGKVAATLWVAGKESGKFLIDQTYKRYKRRRYTISAQEYVTVLNRKYQVVRGNTDTPEAINMNMALQEILTKYDMGETPDQIWRDNKDLFAPGARILGPDSGTYFRWPFKHPLKIPIDEYQIDPVPTPAVMDYYGAAINVFANTIVDVNKHPILYPIRNAGKMLDGGENWEDMVDKGIISDVEQIIKDHFEKHELQWPQVMIESLDSTKIRTAKDELLKRYGAHVKIRVQGVGIKDGQEERMERAERRHMSRTKGSLEDAVRFRQVMKEVSEGARAVQMDPEIAIKNFIRFRAMPGDEEEEFFSE